MKLIGIYKIINKVNDKFYVGSSRNVRKRFNEHRSELRNNKHRNPHLQHAWNKYGQTQFEFVMEEPLTESQCLLREQEYLDRWYGNDMCYNAKKTAQLNSDEANQQIGKSLMGYKHTEETKLKMSESAFVRETNGNILQGRKRSIAALLEYRKNHVDVLEEKRINGLRGSKKSESWKKTMSEKMTGRVLTPEWRKKISQSQKGVSKTPRTKEHQEKLNASQRGKRRSLETRAKMSAALKAYHLNKNKNE